LEGVCGELALKYITGYRVWSAALVGRSVGLRSML
jgi:hypothetical protein